jgi:hypothetical protein
VGAVFSRLACFSLRGCDCSLVSAAGTVLLLVEVASAGTALLVIELASLPGLSLLREACRSLLAAGRSRVSADGVPLLTAADLSPVAWLLLGGVGFSLFLVA